MTEPPAPYAPPHPESTRARQLGVLIEIARRVELTAEQRDEIRRLVAGRTEPSTTPDEVTP